jgi:salicylate hydroxylase
MDTLAGRGKEATAEFGDYHSAEAAHMAHFCIGELVETPTTLP